MKSVLSQFAPVITFVFAVNCIVLELFNFEEASVVFRALLFPFFFMLYISFKRFNNLFFTLYLLFFALAELSSLIIYISDVISYYSGLVFYLLAYGSLVVYLIQNITFKVILQRFLVQSIVLILFSVCIMWSLDRFFSYEYGSDLTMLIRVVENTYNFLLLLVLAFSFVGYLYFDNKEYLLLFIACAFIVFSELVQLSVYLTTINDSLVLVYNILLLFGFYFMYQYFIIPQEEKEVLI